MDKKIIAIAIVAILVAGGIGAYFLLSNEGKDKEINILAAVNTDGSGIYIDSDIKKDSMITIEDSVVTYHKEGWGGLVFGTPGPTTIQHIQLLTIVEEKLGLKFLPYLQGIELKNDTVYYVTGISNATLALGDKIINGGILWQPQYQKIVESDKFQGLALTNELFPGHTCCVFAGVNSYTSSHADETVRLMAAYTKSVNWVNAALKDKTSPEYETLVEESMRIAGTNFTKEEVMEALDTVVFTYGNGEENPLKSMYGSITDLVNNLTDLGQLKATMSDLGFKSTKDFVDRFINESYLEKSFALNYTKTGKMSDVKIAVISGDIHQIAIHMAIKLGYFESYNLNVSLSNATNGAGVATAIQNGDSNFGLLGAPPLTITVINGKLITA